MLKDNLAMLRNMHGYSQEEIAGKIGISRQAYAKWESGATIPDVEKCSLLARAYGTTVDSLLVTKSVEGIGELPPGPIGKNIWGSVTVNDRGQIVIPKGARDHFDLTAGMRLIVLSDESGITLIPEEAFKEIIERGMEWAAKAHEGK